MFASFPATIARWLSVRWQRVAELAVKEVLCRKRPDLEPLLTEMPSPPFSKLYGPVLKHYLGESSPYRKQLIEGQELRNKLVHRPGQHVISGEEAGIYVEHVEAAIFHMLALLYPDDRLVRLEREVTGRNVERFASR